MAAGRVDDGRPLPPGQGAPPLTYGITRGNESARGFLRLATIVGRTDVRVVRSGRLSWAGSAFSMDVASGPAYVGWVSAVHGIDVSGMASPPRRIAFVGAVVAGVGTSYDNVFKAATADPQLEPIPVPVQPFKADALERFGRFLPPSTRGTLRSIAATLPLFARRPYRAVWTQIDLPLLPWMLTWNARRRTPVVYAADSTPRLIRSFGVDYGNWGGTSPAKQRVRDALHGVCLRRCDAVTAWSNWAARSMRDDYGVDPARLHVIPPGVDTMVWSAPPARPVSGPARMLFVGGDFRRKGGELLLEVYRHHLREFAQLDIVTARGAVAPEAGIRVHDDVRSNDPRLVDLYRQADLFVLPTQADCFSMATLEALASGLPVVTCPVGGVGEIFSDGVEGFYVPPRDGQALRIALDRLIHDSNRRRKMGAAARRLAVAAFDAETNTQRIFRLMDSLVAA